MRHSILEERLTRQGFAFDYVANVPLTDLQVDPEARRNIRLGNPLNKERVQQYALAYIDGDQFPPLILYRKGKSLWFVNGMHRFEALKEIDATETDAYVLRLDATQEMSSINRLRRTINLVEGEPMTHEECVEHAVLLVNDGMQRSDAAREMRISPSTLRLRLDVLKVEQRLREVGIEPSRDISNVGEFQRRMFDRIPRNDHFKKVVMLANEARMSAEQAKEFAKAVEQSTSDAEGDLIIEAWRENMATQIRETAGGKIRPASSPIRSYLSKMTWFERNTKHAETSARALGKNELDAAISLIDRFIRSATDLRKHLDALRKGLAA